MTIASVVVPVHILATLATTFFVPVRWIAMTGRQVSVASMAIVIVLAIRRILEPVVTMLFVQIERIVMAEQLVWKAHSLIAIAIVSLAFTAGDVKTLRFVMILWKFGQSSTRLEFGMRSTRTNLDLN